MIIHNAVVNTILSFKDPFTYAELLEKLRMHPEIDWTKKEIQAQVFEKIKEIFECQSIKVVPFSHPIKYFVDELFITIKKRPT